MCQFSLVSVNFPLGQEFLWLFSHLLSLSRYFSWSVYCQGRCIKRPPSWRWISDFFCSHISFRFVSPDVSACIQSKWSLPGGLTFHCYKWRRRMKQQLRTWALQLAMESSPKSARWQWGWAGQTSGHLNSFIYKIDKNNSTNPQCHTVRIKWVRICKPLITASHK